MSNAEGNSIGLTLWECGHPSLFVRCSALLHHALTLATALSRRQRGDRPTRRDEDPHLDETLFPSSTITSSSTSSAVSSSSSSPASGEGTVALLRSLVAALRDTTRQQLWNTIDDWAIGCGGLWECPTAEDSDVEAEPLTIPSAVSVTEEVDHARTPQEDGEDTETKLCRSKEQHEWLDQMRLDLITVLDGLFSIIQRDEQSAADLQRRGLRFLHQKGFPAPLRGEEGFENGIKLPTTIAGTIGSSTGSYHLRTFPQVHTGYASLSSVSVQLQLQTDELDARYGYPSLVPIPHPHPEVNTEVMIAEPKKKKALMDEHRIIPHPRKAAVHAVEDLLTDEEHCFRDCVLLKDHLLRCGSLAGLPTHLQMLLWELFDGEVAEVNALFAEEEQHQQKLQQQHTIHGGRGGGSRGGASTMVEIQTASKTNSKRTSERSTRAVLEEEPPRPMLMEAAQRLHEKFLKLNDPLLRQHSRRLVSTIGHYTQSILWRDQVLQAFKNNGSQWGGLMELESVCPCPPMVVENPFGETGEVGQGKKGTEGGKWEEDMLRLVLGDSPAFAGVFTWCLPILRGQWESALLLTTTTVAACTNRDDDDDDKIEDSTRYVLPLFLVLCLQSVLALVTTLQSARYATRRSPTEFLQAFLKASTTTSSPLPPSSSSCAVELIHNETKGSGVNAVDDVGEGGALSLHHAVRFLLEEEGTANLEVARMVSIGPCKELLAYRLAFVESEGYLETTRRAMATQRERQKRWRSVSASLCSARSLTLGGSCEAPYHSMFQKVDLAGALLETPHSTIVVAVTVCRTPLSSELPPPMELSSSHAAYSLDDVQLPVPRPAVWSEADVARRPLRQLIEQYSRTSIEPSHKRPREE